MELDSETLEQVAKDGSMDYEKWPGILEPLLQRLDQIVHEVFPTPKIPSPDWLRKAGPDQVNPYASDPAARNTPDSPTQSRSVSRTLPPVPPFDSSTSTNATHVSDSMATSSQETTIAAPTIPELLIQQLSSITSTLRTTFATRPPHTIQRLAELVLSPDKHYNTLPAWLRAVDRAVSVTSTADIFPLPQAQALPQGVVGPNLTNGSDIDGAEGSLTNGSGILWTNTDTRDGRLGDDSLGGALLTPIPWLKTEEGTVSANRTMAHRSPRPDDPLLVAGPADEAAAHVELIRMEQEAGIASLTRSPDAEGPLEEDTGLEAVQHARGPDIVGVEDVGLQGGRDVELHIGGEKADLDQGSLGQGKEQGQGQGLGLEVEVKKEDVEDRKKERGEGGDVGGDEVKIERNSGDGDIVLDDADGKVENGGGGGGDDKAAVSGSKGA